MNQKNLIITHLKAELEEWDHFYHVVGAGAIVIDEERGEGRRGEVTEGDWLW